MYHTHTYTIHGHTQSLPKVPHTHPYMDILYMHMHTWPSIPSKGESLGGWTISLEAVLVGGEGGAVVKIGVGVVMGVVTGVGVGAVCRDVSAGTEEEVGVERNAGERGGLGSTCALPSAPAAPVVATGVCEERGVVVGVGEEEEEEEEGAVDTKGPEREGVVVVTAGAGVVVAGVERDAARGVVTGGVPVALSREDEVARAVEPGDAAVVVVVVMRDDVIGAVFDWTELVVARLAGTGVCAADMASAGLGEGWDVMAFAESGLGRVGDAVV